MAHARAQRRVEAIMSDAHEKAEALLLEQAQNMIDSSKGRYARFVNAVGWGPSLFDCRGKLVEEDSLTRPGRKLMEFAGWFYDSFGGSNNQVVARQAGATEGE